MPEGVSGFACNDSSRNIGVNSLDVKAVFLNGSSKRTYT
jgi:hypothetical protein